jgi:hypothetical protein
MASLIATIVGMRNAPTIREVNVRAAPSIAGALIVRLPVGTQNLTVLEVRLDAANAALNGKVYNWLKLRLPDGREGFVRDDLIEIVGDGTSFGYPTILVPTIAFALTRQLPTSTPATPPAAPATPPAAPATPPAAPATPPAAPATPPAAPATPPAAPAPAPVVGGAARAKVIGKTGVNLRAAPVSGNVLSRLNFQADVAIVGGHPQGGTSNYIWVQVDTPSGRGFVRDDFLSVSGDASTFGLSKGDEFPAPMRNYWWVRGFNVNQNPGEPEHLGWDFGANTGEPILCAPPGGTVVAVNICAKCTPDRPSTLMHGFSLGDASIFSDPGWGFGYGTFVIVRYDNAGLPASTKARMTARGMGTAHLFAMYAHLQAASVAVGQTVSAGQQIGTCGNTGNSQATHLHLEVRVSTNPNPQWGMIRSGLFDPGVVYLR